MSFNLLKFKKNQKIENKLEEVSTDFLLIGFDLKSVFDLTQNKNFDQSTFMILDQNERTIKENIFLVDQLPYPWVFQKENSDFNPELSAKECKFYKDGEFRSFSGRHKINNCHPYLLKFSGHGYNYQWSKWWDEVLSDSDRQKLNSSFVMGQVKEVFYRNDMWELFTYDHRVIRTKKLQWNLSPELFLKLFKYEDQYPKTFLNWCSSFLPLNFLLLQVKLKRCSSINMERALIPLTMGTDEGYFLLSQNSLEDDLCLYNMLYVFNESDFQEEDVASKIRLIKKQMMKVFQLNEAQFNDERVFFLPQFTHVANTSFEAVDNFIQNDSIFKFDKQYNYENLNETCESFLQFFCPRKEVDNQIDTSHDQSFL